MESFSFPQTPLAKLIKSLNESKGGYYEQGRIDRRSGLAHWYHES